MIDLIVRRWASGATVDKESLLRALRKAILDLASDIGATTQHQTCRVCGHRDKFDFHIPDDLWQQIVPPEYQNHVVCLGCFDDFATQKGIGYSIDALYFAGDKEMSVFKKEEPHDLRPSPRRHEARREMAMWWQR
jgi:hypothetical protein